MDRPPTTKLAPVKSARRLNTCGRFGWRLKFAVKRQIPAALRIDPANLTKMRASDTCFGLRTYLFSIRKTGQLRLTNRS